MQRTTSMHTSTWPYVISLRPRFSNFFRLYFFPTLQEKKLSSRHSFPPQGKELYKQCQCNWLWSLTWPWSLFLLDFSSEDCGTDLRLYFPQAEKTQNHLQNKEKMKPVVSLVTLVHRCCCLKFNRVKLTFNWRKDPWSSSLSFISRHGASYLLDS